MSTTPSDSEYIDQYDTASPKSLWAVAENYTNHYFGITRCSTTGISLVDNTGSNVCTVQNVPPTTEIVGPPH